MLMTRRSCILIGEAPNAAGTKDLLHLKLAARARDEIRTFNLLGRDYVIRLRDQDPSLWSWVRGTTHVNLLDAYPGAIFPLNRGREEAKTLWHLLVNGAPRGAAILFAGSSVSKSFDFLRNDFDLWRPFLSDGIKLMRVPHPSGRCRTWNDPSQRRLALEKLRALGDSFVEASRTFQDTLEHEDARVFQLTPKR